MKQETHYHITKYNFEKILDGGFRNKYEIKEPYFIKDIPHLEKEKINEILWIKLFLKNPKQIASLIIPIKELDSFYFLFKPTSPAYHSTIDCQLFRKPYLNYQLPEGIKGNQDAAERCRAMYETSNDFGGLIEEIKNDSWFINHFVSIDRDINELTGDSFKEIYKLNSSIKRKIIFVNGKAQYPVFEVGEKPANALLGDAPPIHERTGVKTIDSVIDIVELIEELLTNFKKHYNESARKSGYKKQESIDRVMAPGVFRKYYSDSITQLIIQYHILDINPSLDFSSQILHQFGFHPCSNCVSNFLIEEEGNKEPTEMTVVHTTEEINPSIPFSHSLVFKHFTIIEYDIAVPILNTPETAIQSHEINSSPVGVYYARHKFTQQLQMVIRPRVEAGYYRLRLPTDEFGNDVLICKSVHIYAVKRKDLADNILGKEIEFISISAD